MQRNTALAAIVAVVLGAGCASESERTDAGAVNTSDEPPAAAPAGADSVTATIHDAGGRTLGTLTLRDESAGLAISGRLAGLPPSEHAVHLHMTGRCDAPKFESAGSHWNPGDRQHGSANPQGPHAGDLPNFTVGTDSAGTVEGTTATGSLNGETPLLDADGAAVIVHAGRDDYRSQPSGDSGDPIACGVVEGRVAVRAESASR